MVNEEDEKARKRKERLEQNRISARESRKRKKNMIEELQRTVITLSKENKTLNEKNERLRRDLMQVGAKYPNLVPLHAIMAAPNSATTTTTTTTTTTDGTMNDSVKHETDTPTDSNATPTTPVAASSSTTIHAPGKNTTWNPTDPTPNAPSSQHQQ